MIMYTLLNMVFKSNNNSALCCLHGKFIFSNNIRRRPYVILYYNMNITTLLYFMEDKNKNCMCHIIVHKLFIIFDYFERILLLLYISILFLIHATVSTVDLTISVIDVKVIILCV